MAVLSDLGPIPEHTTNTNACRRSFVFDKPVELLPGAVHR